MKNRIRQLRKDILHLNQTEFGRKIGIGQQSIANIENGTNALTERNFDAICRTWSVNPNWLRHGEGEMFMPPPKRSFLDRLAEEKGLNADEKALIGSIIDMPRPAREAVINWAFQLVTTVEKRTSDEEKEIQIRELEQSIAEQERKLAELKGITHFYSSGKFRKPDDELSREEINDMLLKEFDEVEAASKKPISFSLADSDAARKFGNTS